MAGVSFDLLIGMMFFLIAVWGSGRVFRMAALPAILGEFMAGVLLGPNFLDIVPYASNGECDTIIFPNDESGSSSSSVGRMLAGSVDGPPCKANLMWTPRWTMSDTTVVGDQMHTPDIWSFMGTVGVTLLIMESGMHINFEKVKQIGGQALIVAIVGTTMPLILGMLLVGALFGQDAMYPDGFAAGCALAPTSVGISIKLLSDAKMLNSMAGQTTLTAAFIDDVFSLVLLVLLSSLAADADDAALVIVLRTIAAFAFLGAGVVGGKHVLPMMDKPLSRIPFVRGASIQPRDEVHLLCMLGMLGLCSYLGSLIGSHLLGAFVAGMCFVNVPRSHQVWVTQLKRIIRWLIRIFFAATVGLAPAHSLATHSLTTHPHLTSPSPHLASPHPHLTLTSPHLTLTSPHLTTHLLGGLRGADQDDAHPRRLLEGPRARRRPRHPLQGRLGRRRAWQVEVRGREAAREPGEHHANPHPNCYPNSNPNPYPNPTPNPQP